MSRKESTKFMMRSYIHKIFTPTNDHVFVKDCFIIIHRNKLVLNHNKYKLTTKKSLDHKLLIKR